MIKEQIDQDLKQAMLAGDKHKTTTLRGLKSTILYAEVAAGSRQSGGISDDEVIALFMKEAKKRQESADLYMQGGNGTQAEAELTEKAIIESYLPQQLTDDDLRVIVSDQITALEASSAQDMGKVIAAVKQRTGAQAAGGRIAQMVQEQLR